MDVIPRDIAKIHHQMILSLSRLRCSARLNCLADLSDSTSDWDSDPATDGAPESGAVGVADPACGGGPISDDFHRVVMRFQALYRQLGLRARSCSHTRIFSRQRSRNTRVARINQYSQCVPHYATKGSGHLRRAVIAVTEHPLQPSGPPSRHRSHPRVASSTLSSLSRIIALM
ncbi:unnamed protein product [Trichogramma brassicae]|uniref:Uncharacterized protein n=1 Tax=Trichogramma brassicae TaxID=86971 RepID=A0A6H5HYY6_9HYME|nr:unnamed protein product [Trichogramma brassicae]